MSQRLFCNFQRIRAVMRRSIYDNGYKEYKNIYVCNSALLNLFSIHFPDIVQSRKIGKINNKHFKHWDKHKTQNYINITSTTCKQEWNEINKLIALNCNRYQFVSIGGPSAFVSNHIYRMNNCYNNPKSAHFYLSRHDSNFDGSAYYYHERDAFPVYVNKVNRGMFCVLIDLLKRIRCLVSKTKFIKYCQENAGFVKININWQNIIKSPSIIYTIFFKNFLLMMNNIYLNGKDLNNCLLHTQQTPNVVRKFAKYYNIPFQDLLILNSNKEESKAVYVNIDAKYQCNQHFSWLNKKYGNIPFKILDNKEMEKYGFDLKYIQEIIGFPNDGCINPNFFNKLVEIFGDESDENWMLKDVWYTDNDENGIICKLEHSIESGKVKYIKTKKLSLSLGPSAIYRLNNKSFLNEHMYASGSTSVVFIAIKSSGTYKENADKFIKKCSLCIDSVNQHWTPIEMKKNVKLDVNANGGEDEYHLVAMQMTGGGNFPSRYTTPDVVLNLLKNCEKIFGLKEYCGDSIYYDIIQLRGCGRSVTANNTISFASLNKNNICITYGLGGIGMTTMFANAELINQILYNNNNNNNGFQTNGMLKCIDYKSMVTILDF